MPNKGRYRDLINEVAKRAPRSILEIGVWSGGTACNMIHKAHQQHGKDMLYYGFDLWEDFTPEMAKSEFCPKTPVTRKSVLTTFKTRVGEYCSYHLIQGNTHNTLPACQFPGSFDFIFIDGGHSLDTITADWNNILEKKLITKDTVVVFDDYYHSPELIAKEMGCNHLILTGLPHGFNYKLLPTIDTFDNVGDVQMVKVQMK